MAEVKGASEATPAPPAVPVPAPTQGTGNRSPEPSGTTGTGVTRPRDEGGRFTKGGDKPPEDSTPVPPNEAKPAEAPKPEAEKPKAKRPPPQAFRPTVREKWETVDPEIQEEFLRIEQATKHALQTKAEQAKAAERWEGIIKPYAQHIQGDPVQYVGSLVQTAAALQSSPQPQRAAIIAGLIQSFGVDIKHLAAALDGTAPAMPQQQVAPQQPAMPDPSAYAQQVYDLMQQRMVVEQFTKEAEFLDEPMPDGVGTIRDAVADQLEIAARRNVAMTPQQAYARVVAQHPTVSEALKQREAKANAERSQALTAQAKVASSSLRTEPVVVSPEPSGSGSVLDDVRASFAAHRRR